MCRNMRRICAEPVFSPLANSITLALIVTFGDPAATQGQFNCLPSCDPTDSRMLLVANGDGFKTLIEPGLDLTLIVSPDTEVFEIGIFDGDAQAGVLPDLHWDTGNPGVAGAPVPEFEYTIFADPVGDGSGTHRVAGPFVGSSFLNPANVMPDNAWFDVSIATGKEAQTRRGDYRYRLRVDLTSSKETLIANGFKVRTTETLVLEPYAQPFSFVAQRSSAADEAILYPSGFPGVSTYDGFFSFTLDVPENLSVFSIWDGDFDRGDFDGSHSDTDDPNTEAQPFEPIWSGADTLPEGVAVGVGPSTGFPPDDSSDDPTTDPFLRQPSVRYDVIAPDGQVFANENPSGNQEWEEFTVSTRLGDPTADTTTGSLPAGSYELRVEGVDLASFSFLFTPTRILCRDDTRAPCSPPSQREEYRLGNIVFADLDADGLQDPGEAGVQGVVINLVGSDGNIIDTTVTDSAGLYAFEAFPQSYGVEVAPENFASPTGIAALGGRMWLDDGDGIDAAEPGLANVALHLYRDDGDGMPDPGADELIVRARTDWRGQYLFDRILPGSYWIDVVDSTIPGGLSVLAAGSPPGPGSVLAVGADQAILDLDFPVSGTDPATGIIGRLLWLDADGDGFREPGESGPAGISLELIEVGGDGRLGGGDDRLIAETRTGPGGAYLLTAVPPGTYVVEVTDTAGVLAGGVSRPLPVRGERELRGTTPFSVSAGSLHLDKNFAFRDPSLADIQDFVWVDSNRNGLIDPPETGLANVTINLLDKQSQAIATTTSARNGSFVFPDVLPGEYRLEVTDLRRDLIPYAPTTSQSARGSHRVAAEDSDVLGAHFGFSDKPSFSAQVGTSVKDPVGDLDRQVGTVVDADLMTYDFGYQACQPCTGQVTELTLEYLGSTPDARVEVLRRTAGVVLFDGVVQPGEVFSFRGFFGNRVVLYVDGVRNGTIRTNCSRPVGPGFQRGDFQVVVGMSSTGGLLCPLGV